MLFTLVALFSLLARTALTPAVQEGALTPAVLTPAVQEETASASGALQDRVVRSESAEDGDAETTETGSSPSPGFPPSDIGPATLEHFEKKIRPILVEHCGECHSGNPARAKGGLVVDHREGLLQGGHGGPAVVPGDPDASRLMEALRYQSPDLRMPPRGRLGDAVLADFQRWILDGAPDPRDRPSDDKTEVPTALREARLEAAREFWAFQPPKEPALPEVEGAGFVRSPLDRLVLSALHEAGLSPAPPADRRALIRRLHLDLTGLPPSPAEVEAFLADERPSAVEHLVDRLLASPAFGEHWGRQWLDVARYADSNGLDENLAYVHAYRYRDYVVRAFNEDRPYDRMLHEQIAGDLLPRSGDDADRDALIATGFLTLGPKMLACDDGRKMQLDIVDEQVDTLCRATMGLTMGCARCHDHKFDPLPTEDYYALAGILLSTKTMDNFKVVAQWHEVEVPTLAEREAHQRHLAEESTAKAERDALRQSSIADFLARQREQAPAYFDAAIKLAQHGPGPTPDGVRPVGPLAQIEGLPTAEGLLWQAEDTARCTLLKDTTNWGKDVGVILGKGYAEYDLNIPARGLYQIELRYAAEEPRPMRMSLDGRLLSEQAAGKVSGGWRAPHQQWFVEGVYRFEAGARVLRLERTEGPSPHVDQILIARLPDPETREAPGTRRALLAGFGGHPEVLSHFVQAVRGLPAEVREAAFAGALEDDARETALSSLLDAQQGPFAALSDPERLLPVATRNAIASLDAQVAELQSTRPVLPRAMATEEGAIEDLPVHLRGSYLTLGDPVPRRPPRVLATDPAADFTAPADRSGRLELAHWLTRPEHPLTARVMANRVWLGLFGEGIVRTPDNFGRLGQRPSNPALLDWLALRFVEDGWSIKSLIRRIVRSGTYLQSTAHDAAAFSVDPENRLHWRHDRRRLKAEQLRDSLLAISGRLDRSIGGQLLKEAHRAYVTGTASKRTQYDSPRRSLYLPILRSALYDVFQAFDFADPSMMSGRRPTTTVAPQALFLMNGELVQDCTRAMAEDLLGLDTDEEPADRARVDALYRRTLCRPATLAEVDRALAFVARYRALLESEGVDAAECTPRAWQGLCRVVVASNEFLYVE